MTREQAIAAVAEAARKRGDFGLVSYEADAAVFVDNLIGGD